MTCDDYLSMLETLPVQELNYGEAREHAAYCSECNRVTRVVAARERNMMMAYDSAYPSASAVTVAERAIVTARRQRIAFFYRAGLSIAAVVVAALFVVTRRAVPAEGPAVVEEFNLQCLSPSQAAELLRQEIPLNERVVIRTRPPLAVIEFGGSRDQLEAARWILSRYDTPDRAKCAAEVVVPRVDRLPMSR